MTDASASGEVGVGIGVGIGARLRAARERAGFTVIEAAERLHMEPRLVEALDTETFGLLGAPVYARGHLRRYADLVGENATELQQLYGSSLTPASVPDLRQASHFRRQPPAARALAVPIAVGLVVAAVVGVLAWVVRAARAPQAAPVVDAEPGMSGSEAPPAAGPLRGVAETGESGSSIEAPMLAPTGAGGSASSAGSAMAAEVPRAGASLAGSGLPPTDARSGATELQLRYSADSWTEVYDADGRRLFYNLAAANTERTLAGKAPLRVVLGSARGVDISINGRSAEIPESALRRDVAEFVVNGAGRLATGR